MYFSLPNIIKYYVHLKAERIVFPSVQNTAGTSILISYKVISRFTALLEFNVYSNNIFSLLFILEKMKLMMHLFHFLC
jgi:hypothetical protein